MMALMKIDLWLLRWLVPLTVIVPFITVRFFQMEFFPYSMLIAFLGGMALVQTDEKMKTNRFMYSLPLPTKAFLPARSFVLVIIGFTWLLFETIALLIFGLEDAFVSNPIYHIVGQLTILLVLAPVIIGILTLFKQPVIKWVTLFLAYIVIMVIGSIVTYFGQGLMDYLGSTGFLLAIGFILVGILLFWLLTIGFNAIRIRRDLV